MTNNDSFTFYLRNVGDPSATIHYGCTKLETGDLLGTVNDDTFAELRVTREEGHIISEEKPAVIEEARNKLADEIQKEAKFTSWDYVYYERDAAMDIVDAMIAAGWGPKNG